MIDNLNSLCFGNRGIPTVFDQEIDYYSILCKIGGKLEEVIAETNVHTELYEQLSKQFVQLKAWTEHYFDSLDVQEAINLKIDEMLADGTLVRLIAQAVLTVPVINRPTFDRMFNYTVKNSKHIEPDAYYQLQGGCYLPDKNAYFYVLRGEGQQQSRLTVIDYSTGSEIKAGHAMVGHANWVTYNPGNDTLLITDNETTKVYVVDYLTINVVQTYDLADEIEGAYPGTNQTLASMDYDYIANKYIGWLRYQVEGVYIYTAFEYDFNTRSIKKLNVDDSVIKTKAHYQGACVHNSFIYALDYTEIYCFGLDEDTYRCVNVINLPERFADGMIIGEPENISVKSITSKTPAFVFGSINKGTISPDLTEDPYVGWFYSILISEFNPFADSARIQRNVDADVLWSEGRQNVYLDIESSTVTSNGRANRPFTNPADALAVANYWHVGIVPTSAVTAQNLGDILLYNLDIPYFNSTQFRFNSLNAYNSYCKFTGLMLPDTRKAMGVVLNSNRNKVRFYFENSEIEGALNDIGNTSTQTSLRASKFKCLVHDTGDSRVQQIMLTDGSEVDIYADANAAVRLYEESYASTEGALKIAEERYNTYRYRTYDSVVNGGTSKMQIKLYTPSCNPIITIYQDVEWSSNHYTVTFDIPLSELMDGAYNRSTKFVTTWLGSKEMHAEVTIDTTNHLKVTSVQSGSGAVFGNWTYSIR